MLIVLLGAGNGLINAQLKQSDRFLSSSMVIFGGETSKPYKGLKEGRQISVQTRDLETTGKEFGEVIDEVGAQYYTTVTISQGQQYISTQLAGVFPNHNKIDKTEMLHGRFINQIDIKEKRKVLVLGNNQAKELAPGNPTSLIGKYLNVGSFAFQVVGIYKENENGQARAFSSYSAIKSIYGANSEDVGRIEFTFHGLETEQANEDFEKTYRQRLNANH